MPIIAGAMAVGALASFVGGLFGGAARKQSQYAAAALTDKQASLREEQVVEENRRSQIEAGQLAGGARAAAGASGFWAGGGSMQKYVQAFSTELNTRIAYARKIGLEQVALGHEAANAQREGADASMLGDIFGSTGNLLGTSAGIFTGLKMGQTAPLSSGGSASGMSAGMGAFPTFKY